MKRIALLLPAVLLALAVTNFRGWRQKLFSTDDGQSPTVRSIAVLPLLNLSNDPEQQFFADGMTDELITNLARISSLRVISRTSAMAYLGTKKPAAQIARELARTVAHTSSAVCDRPGHTASKFPWAAWS